MSPMKKSLTALAASALLATVGYATAQSTDATTDATTTTTTQTTDTALPPAMTTDATAPQTITTTTSDTATQVIPAPPTGVVELSKPKNTVAPVDKQADGPLGMENNLMTTGVVNGVTRPSVGDHATPPIPAQPTVLAVTTERTTTTTTTPEVAPTPAPEPAAAPAPEPTPAPMPAPRADRN
jgi:hypothetical protein